MTGYADMHVHTDASDGTLSPARAVEEALRAGLRAIGIVDHDTLGGIVAAKDAGARLKVEVIPGIEMGCDHEGGEVHIIGYYPDLSCAILRKTLRNLRKERHSRLGLILRNLRDLGLPLELDSVLKHGKGGVPGRPHVAAAMLEKGYVTSMQEAFDRYLGEGRPAYAPRLRLSPEETVKLLRQASAVTVLAHPGSIRKSEEEGLVPERLLSGLLGAGLDGLEAYHPLHSHEDSARYAALASERGLLITGGSDFHGAPDRVSVEVQDSPARRIGEVKVPYERVRELKSRAGLA